MSEKPEKEYEAKQPTETDFLVAIAKEYMQLDEALALVEQKRQNIALLRAELQKIHKPTL